MRVSDGVSKEVSGKIKVFTKRAYECEDLLEKKEKKKKSYLGCPGDVLKEEGQVLPAERSQNVPEPLHLLVRALEVGVLRVILPGDEKVFVFIFILIVK